MAVSKRQRFNVFKRDGFRCQYCGKSPPDTVLEVDHVVPVSAGGKDHPANLLTACFDCNRGKSDQCLEVIPRSVDAKMQAEMERAEQMEALNKWLLKQRKQAEVAVNQIEFRWMQFTHPTCPMKYSLTNAGRATLRTFLARLPSVEILDAIDVVEMRSNGLSGDLWKYFCGICWSKIKQRNSPNEA